MPCDCGYMVGSGDAEKEEEYEKTINELGQKLCFLCGELEFDDRLDGYADKAILNWWKKHQKEDTKRVSPTIRKYLKQGWEPQDIAEKLVADAEKVHSVSRFHVRWFEELVDKIKVKMKAEELDKQSKAELIKKAKNKLTAEERRALGVK